MRFGTAALPAAERQFSNSVEVLPTTGRLSSALYHRLCLCFVMATCKIGLACLVPYAFRHCCSTCCRATANVAAAATAAADPRCSHHPSVRCYIPPPKSLFDFLLFRHFSLFCCLFASGSSSGGRSQSSGGGYERSRGRTSTGPGWSQSADREVVQVEEAAGRRLPRLGEQACLTAVCSSLNFLVLCHAPGAGKERGEFWLCVAGGRRKPPGGLFATLLHLLVEAFRVGVHVDRFSLLTVSTSRAHVNAARTRNRGVCVGVSFELKCATKPLFSLSFTRWKTGSLVFFW